MCPPDTCFATGGCTGSRVIDKQPVVCGIDTVNADVGTTYALQYVAYNSAGMKATVQRVISVVSPCDSGQYLCGNTCSGVSQEGPFLACVPLLACTIYALLFFKTRSTHAGRLRLDSTARGSLRAGYLGNSTACDATHKCEGKAFVLALPVSGSSDRVRCSREQHAVPAVQPALPDEPAALCIGQQ